MGFSTLIKDIKDIGRFERILAVLVKYEMGFLIDKFKLKHLIPVHMRIQRDKFRETITEPKAIRKAMGELGGAFVKLGQLLSLRPDLIPEEYSEEFKNLQDNVRPFSGDKAKEIVEKELLKSNKKLAYFNKKPIASASIAQVHEAVLPNGKKVVVKVQREDAENKFKIDIDILYHLARMYESKYGKDLFDAVGIIEEFEKYTLKELDFLKEGKNIQWSMK